MHEQNMKQYRKFESWQRDANHCLEHPDRVEIDDLRKLGYGFSRVEGQVAHDAKRLRLLLETLKKLREGKGPGRGNFEEHIMRRLLYLAFVESGKLYSCGFAPRPLSTLPESIGLDQRSSFIFLQELCLYAIDCLSFSRPRDSLAGHRRSFAFEILSASVEVLELPESVFDHLKRILKSPKGNSIYGVLVFCENYYQLQPEGVPEEIEELLLRVVQKTDSRGIATGALSVLVEAGNISEFEALDRIDDWKERNHYGFWS
jgi:hypothetical protein